ncbi:MAG: hypothetical protein LBN21_02490 [Treponema sp.]|jgi:hypothetical protein|nr:hypothetical protein [Treponema sp.]
MNAVAFDTAILDGKIEVPPEYRRDFSSFVKVILIEGENREVQNAHAVPDTDIGVEERIAALDRLDGILAGYDIDLDKARMERLSRQC